MSYRSPSHVAIFSQDLSGGGAERMLVNLSDGLTSLGVSVDLVLVRREGPYLETVPPRVRLVDLETRTVQRSIPALARYIRESQPDVLLSTLVHVNVAAILACAIAGAKTRVIVREANYVSHARYTRRSRFERLAYRLIPVMYPRADRRSEERRVGEE